MWEMDYDKAASVWIEKDKDSVHIDIFSHIVPLTC